MLNNSVKLCMYVDELHETMYVLDVLIPYVFCCIDGLLDDGYMGYAWGWNYIYNLCLLKMQGYNKK